MSVVEEIIKSAKEFYSESDTEGARFRSWEYCYLAFSEARNGKSKDIDYLALQLGFYLASWGMYRGSSFLLDKDYTVHKGAVEIVLEKQYDDLLGIQCKMYLSDSTKIGLLLNLTDRLKKYYFDIGKTTERRKDTKHDVSDILITKILLGTLGCTPAYDEFVKKALGDIKITKSFGKRSIKELAEFYQKYEDEFKELEKISFGKNNTPYPQMKLLDMGLWKLGKEIKRKEAEEAAKNKQLKKGSVNNET